MADIIFVAIALAFFALCALYVRWCDTIIGPDVFEVVGPLDSTDASEGGEAAA